MTKFNQKIANKAYMMVHIVTKFRDSSFSHSEVKVGGAVLLSFLPKNEVEKATQNRFEVEITSFFFKNHVS